MQHRIILIGLIACGLLGFSTMSFAGTWEERADMPQIGALSGGIWGFGISVVGGKIYTIGGAVDNTHQKYTDLTEEYDPKTDTWTKKADMPIEFFDMAASFVNSGKAYIIGGKPLTEKKKMDQSFKGGFSTGQYWNMMSRRTNGKGLTTRCQPVGGL